MHSFFIYGCTINSVIPLGESFKEGRGSAEIVISEEDSDFDVTKIDWFHHIGEERVLSRFGRRDGFFYVELPGLCFYKISSDGSEISFRPEGELSLSELQGLLLTQIIPLALSLQGKLILHASSVRLQGKAVCFLGEQGMGKSTLAAACVASGLELISDDAVPIEFRSTEYPIVKSAYPEVRIESEVADSLFGDKLKRTSMFAKVRTYVPNFIVEDSLQLSRLYVLAAAEEISIKTCTISEVLETILSNSFRIDLLNRDSIAEEFNKLSAVFELVPINILAYPRKLSALADVVAAIKGFEADQA